MQPGTYYFRGYATNRFGSQGVATAPAPVAVTIDLCLTVVGTITLGQTVAGTLEPGDCLRPPGRFQDRWGLTLPSATIFAATLTSPDFGPFIGSLLEGATAQVAGRSIVNPGSVTAEHILPAGTYWLFAASQATDPVSPPTGSYTLSADAVDEPQVGCMPTAFVTGGSVAAGRITSEDCAADIEGEPDVKRWWDGYSILLRADETVSVTLTADFPFRFSRWSGSEFQEWITDIPAGESRSFTVTSAATRFHSFYVISDRHEGAGSYLMTFSAITGGAAASAADASPAAAITRWVPPAGVRRAGRHDGARNAPGRRERH